MKKSLLAHRTFITGTMILTASGILTRIIGFFYRIFLSRLIGAEGLGIYQLIAPVTSLGFALTAGGIQTALSRYVSAAIARKNDSAAAKYLAAGIVISLKLSIAFGLILYNCADTLASEWLKQPECADLLRILAFTFAPSCIHACINGYCYAIKKTALPSACQLMEQTARVLSVWIMYLICAENGTTFDLSMAVWGLVIGEIVSTLLSVSCFRAVSFDKKYYPSQGNQGMLRYIADIAYMAAPLTASRVIINIFAAYENTLIPIKLREFGLTSSEALSIYGVLTGMAMSVVMFPSVLSSSASVLLMPAISEANASGNSRLIRSACRRSLAASLIMGFMCTAGFCLTGRFIGNVVFDNSLAGSFIVTLGFICPFMYMTVSQMSILNGLGRPGATFILNIISCSVRIAFVQLLVARIGIKGYMTGLIASQIITALLSHVILRYNMRKL